LKAQQTITQNTRPKPSTNNNIVIAFAPYCVACLLLSFFESTLA
jgi:hypothetical protein